ncbi:hypothetical protein Pcinc_029685 [Petrolisthes cinctipes]|uniref:Uncharacterized protein n=1 Tax=Petrolisthes cinctipes TaxID=88211 RepID=A0AAE1F0T4_PETCI|nr:hypothetical protein Pcinc_029685 [Petrolisthes cinctipes]
MKKRRDEGSGGGDGGLRKHKGVKPNKAPDADKQSQLCPPLLFVLFCFVFGVCVRAFAMQGVARSWSLIIRALIRTTDCRSWGTREGTREGQGEKKLKDWVDWGAGDELLDCSFERLVR